MNHATMTSVPTPQAPITAHQATHQATSARAQVLRLLGMLPVLIALYAALVALMYLKNPAIAANFTSLQNTLNVLDQASVKLVLAVGMTFVILTGGIDLSVGAVLACAAVLGMATTLPAGTELNGDVLYLSYLPEALAIPVFLVAGLAIGALSGVFVARLRINPFVATLAAMIIWRGAAYLCANGSSIINEDIAFAWLGNSGVAQTLFGSTSFYDLSWLVLIAIVVVAASWLILNRTVLGVHIYAIGGNRLAAHLTGINVARVLIFVYAISGLLAGLAAAMTSARIFGVNGKLGETYELDAIAAVVLGGTSLTGGVGRVTGTVIGVLFIEIMNTGLTALNVSSFWQMVAKGTIILIAVVIDNRRTKVA